MSDHPPPTLPAAPAIALTALALVACAGEPADFGPGDDPGTGTSTLVVEAIFLAVPRGDTAALPEDFDTSFQVKVVRNGARPADARVVVRSVAGEVVLGFDTRAGGTFVGTQPSYRQVYRLDITTGADAVTDVRVDGPDPHTLTAPTADARVDGTAPLTVAWTRLETTTAAIVSTRALAATEVPDTGSFQLEAGGLTSAPDRPEDELVTLDRRTTLVPAGGVTSSEVTVTVRATRKLVVEPTLPPME